MKESARQTAFVWNAGGWFGSQVGSTLWLLILGLGVARRDPLAGSLAVGGFLALNAWGLSLWRSRARLGAYAGIQRFLLAATAVVAVVVVVAHARSTATTPRPGALASTFLPGWVVLMFPGLMLLFWLRERLARREPRDDSAG